ncbi:MAG TPA: hypothetical protein CFH84_11470 [Sulfurimonas sp. UBA12504]|nr:MAG: hypothetical protein A2019_03640 [Sulfurimonas sp. GWF2_37_8]DAB29078.1 MAG TPA: hypothetical protein CFH84_11470 [Sulfurimonas sp. UBA12504]
MKHSELLKLLHTHKESIDRAYREGSLEHVSGELVESTLFVKINQRYKLNKNYLNFVDSLLQRVDYTVIFGNYENEYKELLKAKKRYQESKDGYYVTSILSLIENLYFKFYNRDREIGVLLLRLQNDTSLDIDILIENGADILEKVSELIEANEKIGAFFREDLRGVERSIDILLQSIGISLLGYIENIDRYIQELNLFLVQTKKRRLQNKQFMQLANQILSEETQALDEHLLRHAKHLYYTITPSQKNKVAFLPDERDIAKIFKELHSLLHEIKVVKPLKNAPIKLQETQKLEIVDLEEILKGLHQNICKDIFLFIYGHPQLQRYKEQELLEEAFKVYMQILTCQEVVFTQEFNHYGIKVAQWV